MLFGRTTHVPLASYFVAARYYPWPHVPKLGRRLLSGPYSIAMRNSPCHAAPASMTISSSSLLKASVSDDIGSIATPAAAFQV